MGIFRFMAVSALCLVVSVSCFDVSFAEAASDGTGFHIKAGAVYMTRDGENDPPLLLNTAAATALSASDVELGWEPGLEVCAGYKGETFIANVRYLGALEWEEHNRDLMIPTGLFIAHTPLITGVGTSFVDTEYMSQLDSVELNFGWRPTSWLTIMAGPRWVLLDEDLSITMNFGPIAYDIIRVENKMLGGQVGAMGGMSFMDGRVCADLCGKIGYFSNEVATDITLTQPPVTFPGATVKKDVETLLAEAGLEVKVAIIDNLAFVLGYEGLWIQKAALAPDQMAVTDPFVTGAASVETDGIIYHGGKASLVYSW